LRKARLYQIRRAAFRLARGAMSGPMTYLVAQDDATAEAVLLISELKPEDQAALVAWMKRRKARK